MTSPLLRCEGLTVRFGGVVALDQAEFVAEAGTIAAIIGPNGAGKTTLLNAITGFAPLSGGRITLGERDLTKASPNQRGMAGVVRTFQNLEIFDTMDVLENVLTGAHRRIRYTMLDALLKTPRYFREEREVEVRSREMLEFVGLGDLADSPAGDLPFGKQRLLEIARAVVSQPDLLLLDEPAAGLNMKETRLLGDLILRIRDELDVTIVLVEHDMDLVMSISDVISVLHFGQMLTSGTPAQIQSDPRVVAAYLGEDDEDEDMVVATSAGGAS